MKALYVAGSDVYFLTTQGTEVAFSPFSLRDRTEKPLQVEGTNVFPIADGLAVTRWQVQVTHQGTLVLGNRLCSRVLPALIEDGLQVVEVHTRAEQAKIEVHSVTAAPIVLVLYGNNTAWTVSEASRNVRGVYLHGKGASVHRPASLDAPSHADDRPAYADPSGSSFNQYTRSTIGLPIHAIVDASGLPEIKIDESLLASLPLCTVGRGAIRTNCRPQ